MVALITPEKAYTNLRSEFFLNSILYFWYGNGGIVSKPLCDRYDLPHQICNPISSQNTVRWLLSHYSKSFFFVRNRSVVEPPK